MPFPLPIYPQTIESPIQLCFIKSCHMLEYLCYIFAPDHQQYCPNHAFLHLRLSEREATPSHVISKIGPGRTTAPQSIPTRVTMMEIIRGRSPVSDRQFPRSAVVLELQKKQTMVGKSARFKAPSQNCDSVSLTFCYVTCSITRCRTGERRALPSISTGHPNVGRTVAQIATHVGDNLSGSCDLGTLCAGASETDTASRPNLIAGLHDLIQTITSAQDDFDTLPTRRRLTSSQL